MSELESNVCGICGGIKSSRAHEFLAIQRVFGDNNPIPMARLLHDGERVKYCSGHPENRERTLYETLYDLQRAWEALLLSIKLDLIRWLDRIVSFWYD